MGTDAQAGAVSPSEIREALARVASSDEFRASPQLIAFLTFVVNAELRGEGSRIKGYTIGIEALGRSHDFDPLTDSVVRVVAGRLRRALERYYAREGVDRSLIIELPRGRYVPLFRKGAAATQASAEAGTADAPAEESQETPSGLAEAAGPENPAAAEIAPHGVKGLGFRSILLACLALAAIGLTLFKMREAGPNIGTPPAASPGPVAERTARVAPAIFVDAFSTIGQPRGAAFAPDPLRRKVADAMARFDGIVIAEAPTAGAKPLSWSEYRFTGSVEYHEDGTTTLGFRLIDMSDGTVVWSRTFPRLHVEGDAGRLEEAILREVVPAVAQPFGIVWTRELASHMVTDARRACILDAIEYWRSFNPARHEVVRQCLERLAAQEPRYAPVYSGLALVYLRDFFLDIAHQGEMPALDRGLQFAEHAVELRPHSARAHDMLSTIWFARGETDLGFGAVKRAIELNPYDTNIIATYGAHLVSIGEVDRGLAMLDDAGARSTVGQSWFEFYRFLARYLKGDVAGASLHASMIVGSDSLYSALAHAVLAGRTGDTARGNLAVRRLIALNPAWRTEPKKQLAKFFPATEIRERLLQDLHAAGIPPTD